MIGVRPELFASPSGMDIGIALEAACDATVVHNTVVSSQPPYSSIEWRWPETDVVLVNNLVSHDLRERDGAVASVSGNLVDADVTMLVDLAGHDAHLAAGAAAIGAAIPAASRSPPPTSTVTLAPPDVGAGQHVR